MNVCVFLGWNGVIMFGVSLIKNLNQMLTQQQKAEAEKKLKNINEELAIEEELKATVKRNAKIITDTINSMGNNPKAQLDLIRNLANNVIPQKVSLLDSTASVLVQLQEKLKSDKERFSRQAINLLEEKQRIEGGIDEIKKTILNIQKTVKESVEEEVKKRKKIEDDLEKSLDDIRSKIVEFDKESETFDKENAELKEKIEGLKGKLAGIEDDFKKKAEEKDEEVKSEKEGLNEKLKALQVEVEKATELNKEYSATQKKNFDNKLSLYIRTKKFPQFCSSFESSAKTLDTCKQELMKGVTRLNIATETIEKTEKEISENSNLFLIELKRQKEKEGRLDEIKKEKETVRARIIDLQNKIKEKKAATA